jgi:hypothetical protein
MDTETTDTDALESEHVESTDTATEASDQGLGDGGKKAIEAERKARRDAEKSLKTMQSELETLRAAQMTEADKAIATARAEGAAEVLTSVNRKLFSAEVRAASAGVLADPDLLSDPDVAVRLLGLGEIPTTGDGDVDSAAIAQAIESLLDSKPYLKANGSATRPAGSADQGGRSTPAPADPSILTDPKAVLEWARSNRTRRF